MTVPGLARSFAVLNRVQCDVADVEGRSKGGEDCRADCVGGEMVRWADEEVRAVSRLPPGSRQAGSPVRSAWSKRA